MSAGSKGICQIIGLSCSRAFWCSLGLYSLFYTGEVSLRYTETMPLTTGRKVLLGLAILCLLFALLILFAGGALISVYGPTSFAALLAFLGYKQRWNAYLSQFSLPAKAFITLVTYLLLAAVLLGNVLLITYCIGHIPGGRVCG